MIGVPPTLRGSTCAPMARIAAFIPALALTEESAVGPLGVTGLRKWSDTPSL